MKKFTRWQTTPPPLDRPIVILGAVVGSDELGGFSKPLCCEAIWDAGSENWLRGELTICFSLDEKVVIHYWIDLPAGEQQADEVDVAAAQSFLCELLDSLPLPTGFNSTQKQAALELCHLLGGHIEVSGDLSHEARKDFLGLLTPARLKHSAQACDPAGVELSVPLVEPNGSAELPHVGDKHLDFTNAGALHLHGNAQNINPIEGGGVGHSENETRLLDAGKGSTRAKVALGGEFRLIEAGEKVEAAINALRMETELDARGAMDAETDALMIDLLRIRFELEKATLGMEKARERRSL